MTNWCENELAVTSHPDDKEKLKALMFNNESGELDFELASPCPEAMEGMLLGSKEKIEFNKALETRKTLLNTNDLISLLRQKNENRDPITSLCFTFLRDNITSIADEQIIKKDSVYNPDDNFVSEDVYKAELLFLDELEKELVSHPCYTSITPVENILGDILNSYVDNTQNKKNFLLDIQHVWAVTRKCSPSVEYGLKVLDELYVDECSRVYGSPCAYEWRIENWGTRWNVDESRVFDDFTYVFFETAWSPPTGWLYDLADKAAKAGIRDFTATLRYAEIGMWFGGEFFIAEPGNCRHDYWEDSEIEDFLGIEPEYDEEEMGDF